MNFFRDPDFRAVLRAGRRRLAGGVLLLVGRSLVGVSLPWLVGRALNSVFELRPAEETRRLVALYLVAAVVAAACQYGMRLVLVAASRDFEFAVRNSLFRKLLSLSSSFFDRSRTGDLLSRLTGDVEAVRMAVGPGVMYLLDTGLRTALALAVMAAMSPVLTAWALLPIGATILSLRRILIDVQDLSLKVQEEQGALAARAQESFAGARVVKAFAREEAEADRFARASRRYVELSTRLARSRALLSCLIETGGGAVLVVVALVGGLKVVDGALKVGDLAAFVAYVQMLVWPMIAIGWVLGLWQRGLASEGRLEELRGAPPEVADPPTPRALPSPVRGAVSFRGLTYVRPGSDRPQLVDVTLDVPAGSSLGIVGRTGAGKSTLVQLLPRLLDPPPGTTFVDGIDVRDLRVADLRSLIAFVPQESLLFSDTLGANVAFGLDAPDSARIAEAARRACLDEAVASFPAGFATVVGERGVTLSGGQRQRAAIARALAVDAPILVLDDCLSAVDAETEERVLDRLEEVIRARTTLVVTHRTSAARRLDRVVVLDEGRVVEFGTPDELLAADGAFAELVRLQRAAEELEAL